MKHMTAELKPSPKGNAKHDGGSSEFEFVIENMRQGLWRLNPIGVVTYANAYLAEWLEATREDLVGQHFSRFRSLRSIAGNPVDRSLSQRYEAEFRTKSGITRRAIVVTSPTVDSFGQPTGTMDLITDITAEHAVQAKLVQEVQQMSELASTDALTGVANRHGFDKAFKALSEKSMDEPFGLIVLDLNQFKPINDTHGHEWGDRVLCAVAHRIKAVVRDADIVARFGGDEFAVLLPNASISGVEEIEARLREKLDFVMPGNGTPIHVSVSVGNSHSSRQIDNMLHAADQEMYRVKQSCRTILA